MSGLEEMVAALKASAGIDDLTLIRLAAEEELGDVPEHGAMLLDLDGLAVLVSFELTGDQVKLALLPFVDGEARGAKVWASESGQVVEIGFGRT